jgi:hypothetical protein
MKKEVTSTGKKSRGGWKPVFARLASDQMLIFPLADDDGSGSGNPHPASDEPEDIISVRKYLTDIALNYTKRPHVFRMRDSESLRQFLIQVRALHRLSGCFPDAHLRSRRRHQATRK